MYFSIYYRHHFKEVANDEKVPFYSIIFYILKTVRDKVFRDFWGEFSVGKPSVHSGRVSGSRIEIHVQGKAKRLVNAFACVPFLSYVYQCFS